MDFKNLNCDIIKLYTADIIRDTTAAINQIVNVDGTRTFANTIQSIITVSSMTEYKQNSCGYAKNFYIDEQIREAGNVAQIEIENFLINCYMRKDFYTAILAYYEQGFGTEKEHLHLEECKYVDFLLRKFKRNGLHLNEIDYDTFGKLSKEISQACAEFSKNIAEDNTELFFTKIELAGVPDHWFSVDKSSDDKFRVTLKYPDYFPIMKYAHNEETRRKLYIAYADKCATENTELITRVIKIRYQMAKLLGYETFADYKTEINMIKTAQNALEFEHNMNQLFTEPYQKEMEKLATFAQSFATNPLTKSQLDSWDYMYYIRAFTEAECDLDMTSLRKYFPLNVVRDGIFTIYQKLLGLQFDMQETDNKWHDDVTLYSVKDSSTDELLGYFYLDMYSREGKFGHAAVFGFESGCDTQGERKPHIVTIACNFPRDGCIDFSDVKTFFHEFGHVMHQICSRSHISDFAGFSVETDFEAPSQFCENWCYDKACLQLMSKHTETGESVPQDIINKLIKSKNFMCGYNYKRQLLFGLFDLTIHTIKFDENTNVNVQDIWYQIESDVLGINSMKCHPFATFGHMMSGYEAGYYGLSQSGDICG